MSGWTLNAGGQRTANIGAVTASTTGTQVASASNAKGSWVELSAATPFDAAAILVNLGPVPSGQDRFMVDIAVGAAAAEVIIVPDLHYPSTAYNRRVVHAFLPVAIPAGSRVAARARKNGFSTDAIGVSVTLFSGTFLTNSYRQVEACGIGTTEVQTLTADSSAHTKGAWSELRATTTFDYAAGLLIVAANTDLIRSDSNQMIDIGIGAAASEVVVVPDLLVAADSVNDSPGETTMFLPLSIPAGSRVAARIQSDEASDTIGVALYGFG